MEREQKIEVLESLLSRVRSNAALPRARPAMAAVAAADDDVVVLDDDETVPAALLDHIAARAPAPEPVDEVDIQDLELLDDDIVELSSEDDFPEAPAAEAEVAAISEDVPEETPAAASAEMDVEVGTEVEIDFDMHEEAEEPPASSRRPIAAQTRDQALAGAAHFAEEPADERIMTPPPESGPQEAMLPHGALAAPPPPAAPKPEQLGQTLELEEPTHARLELERKPSIRVPEEVDELEVPIPSGAPGQYLGHPADELEPESVPPAQPAPIEPELTARRAQMDSGPVARAVGAPREFKPETFAELLRASLDLGS